MFRKVIVSEDKSIMKTLALLGGLVLLSPMAVSRGQQSNAGYVSAGGYVPNEVVAVKIAEAVLMPVYGEKQIASERPFKATLKDDVWTVQGTLTCPDGKGGITTFCVGGTATVKLSKVDARVLFMMHYK
jgi:hypothetical protein